MKDAPPTPTTGEYGVETGILAGEYGRGVTQ